MKQVAKRFCVTMLIVLAITVNAKGQGIELAKSPNSSTSDTSYWQAQTIGIPVSTLNALSVVDGSVCWLLGDSNKIIRTIDGGNTWEYFKTATTPTKNLNVIEAVNDDLAFVSTATPESANIFRTSDGGSTWTKVFSQDSGKIDGIKMFDAENGIALGEPVGGLWTIIKTTNGGDSWFSISTVPQQINGGFCGVGLDAFDTNGVWFNDSTGRCFFSFDYGNTWSYSPDSNTTPSKNYLIWINSRDLFIQIGNGIIACYNGGYNISGYVPGFPYNKDAAQLFCLPNMWDLWLVHNVIYYSPDRGKNWTTEYPNGLNKPTKKIDMVTLGAHVFAWAIGVGDTVYRYYRVATNVEEHPQQIPLEFSLNQNYPNPFNPKTIINFQLPTTNYVTLKVYNILGQIVATIVNEVQEAGYKSVSFDGSKLANGIYYYKLNAGNYNSIKKMLLMK